MSGAWRPTRTVQLRENRLVVVQEMDWGSSMDFLAILGEKAGDISSLFNGGEYKGENQGAGVLAKGNLGDLVKQVLPRVVTTTRSLGDFLLAHAVVDTKAVDGIGIADALCVIRAALEINLSPDVTEAAGALVKTIGVGLRPIPTQPAPQS